MKAWILRCAFCRIESIYADIPEDIESYFVPKTPVFPPDGVKLTCPGCKRNETYGRSDLVYGEDRTPDAIRLKRWALTHGKAQGC